MWNAQVLLRELRQRGYGGGYTILKDWLQPQRAAGVARGAPIRNAAGQAGASGLGPPGLPRNGRRTAPGLGLHDHAGLQPPDVGASGAGPETGNAAADARGRLPGVGRGSRRDPVRPDEDGLAGHR